MIYQDANDLRDIRQLDTDIEILVDWQGLPDQLDLTWEPLLQVEQDLPGVLQDFLHTAEKRQLKKNALALCSFE